MMQIIIALQSTCMEVYISLSCLFVHEPPYLNYTSVLQSHGSSHINHLTALHVRVGLTQVRSNYNFILLLFYH